MPNSFELQSSLHVGIIMDGNGRWATGRGMPRIMGRFPKSICVSVECGFPRVVRANTFVHQIAAISLTNRNAEFF